MERKCDMGPCRSLATMPLVRRSTVSRSWADSPVSLRSTRPSSARRIVSARPCSLVIMGTVPSDACHVPNESFSSRRSSSASSTRRCRRAWFAATTALRSSTLYALIPSTLLSSLSSMLRGTEMSTSITSRFIFPSRLSARRIGSIAPVHAKVTWAVPTTFSMSGRSASFSGESGNSSMSSSTRAAERLTMVIDLTPRGVRCCTRSRAILPAPRIAMSSWDMSRSRSPMHFCSTSSTAAEEIDTPPRAMPVSERTRFPADTAVFSIRVSTLPAAPSGSVASS
mmetsp:Transcript_6238/g.15137  ORF Transcript_6238/g.15137 Transcript_6238/m.15137 type:complete len:282 (-) Transcript_6238:874-1719(-)